MAHPGWTVRREAGTLGLAGREVFTSPEGLDYVRTDNRERTDLVTLTMSTPGLGPLVLRPYTRKAGT